ncbi:hypothetical protein [Marinoscillum pacificum]|uniref:hypothetical protein n=1 Tax=Marinoscillum pacificum TaxID=392723 RepID=UPI00215869E5|nr:hypothetical protein [Marinoscillum pacificum]
MRILTLIIVIVLISCTETEPPCFDTNCADYESRAAAQADYEANPECRSDLDRDNDGKACEDYFRSNDGGTGSNGGGCPTTANCGCSNKKKADCASACCQWVVGSGCKCK